MSSLMSRNDLLDRIVDLLDIAPSDPHNPYLSLFDDWGLDSLQTFQLIIITESLADCAVPPPEVPELYTPGDVYDYYCTLKQ